MDQVDVFGLVVASAARFNPSKPVGAGQTALSWRSRCQFGQTPSVGMVICGGWRIFHGDGAHTNPGRSSHHGR